MHLRCPHCQNPIEIADVPSSGEVTCAGCGSSFQLDKFATATWDGPAKKRIGKFEVLATVGHGAFGTVLKAHDAELDRTVAIKVPRASNVGPGPEDVDRFLREARSVAQLRFPSIIAIHEVGADNGMPYLVCDFVEGITLADHLTGRGFSFTESATLVAEVADALQYAHSLGVVHRDVKPSNIMIRPDGSPCVMDFGLAKRDAGEITMTIDGQILGTPAYMSPEQARGESHKVDGKSDVYSLGVILYQLLTNDLPFRGNKAMLLHQVVHDEPKSPRHLNDKIPRDLETIALKAMAKEPGRRYASAKEMAEDLRRWLTGEPILARPVGRAERAWRWTRRHPTAAALAATSILAVLSLIGVGIGVWVNLALKEANDATQRALDAEADQKRQTEAALALERAQFYLNRIVLAEREWHANNVRRCRQLLEECPEELRGWEWNYLHRLCHSELQTQTGLGSVHISPDARWLYGPGKEPRTLQLTDRANNARIHVLKHSLPIVAQGWSAKGRLIVSAASVFDGKSAEVKIWDFNADKVVAALADFKHTVHAVAISSDGERVALGCGLRNAAGDVWLWEPRTGQPPRRLGEHVGSVFGVAFSPDGRWLATSCAPRFSGAHFTQPGEFKLWDAATGTEKRLLHGHTAAIVRVLFSPDGSMLATTGADGTARLWNVATGENLHTLLGHKERIWAVAFSPDGKAIATGSEDHTIRVWDAATGALISLLRGHTAGVNNVSFSSDGTQLFSTGQDATLRTWDPRADPSAFTLHHFHDMVSAVAFSPDGGKLATIANSPPTVALWDSRSGLLLRKLRGHGVHVSSVAFSPDGRFLASGSWDRTVRFWDAATGRLIWTFGGHKEQVTAVTFSPKGETIASCSGDHQGNAAIKLLDAATGKEIRSFAGLGNTVLATCFSPDAKQLASASIDGTVAIWDVQSGTITKKLTRSGNGAMAVVYHPRDPHLAASRMDGSIQLWNSETFQELATLHGHSHSTSRLKFSPDGRHLASVGGDRTLKLWDVRHRQEVLTLRGHSHFVYGLAFSPDGERLASSDHDGIVKIWESRTPTPETLQQRAAAQFINELLPNAMTKAEARAAMEKNPTLTPAIRAQVLRMLDHYHEEAFDFSEAAWVVVRYKDAGADKLKRALRQAEAAVRLQPDDPEPRVMVGLALHRLGRHTDALQTLEQSNKLYAAAGKPVDRVYVSTTALVRHALGDQAEAASLFQELQKTRPLGPFGVEVRILDREALQLIEGKAKALPLK